MGAKRYLTPRATLPRLARGLARPSPAIAPIFCLASVSPHLHLDIPLPSPPPKIRTGKTSSVASSLHLRQKAAVIVVAILVYVGCLIYQCQSPGLEYPEHQYSLLSKRLEIVSIQTLSLPLSDAVPPISLHRNATYPPISAVVTVTIPTPRETVDVHLQSFVPYTPSDRIGFNARYTKPWPWIICVLDDIVHCPFWCQSPPTFPSTFRALDTVFDGGARPSNHYSVDGYLLRSLRPLLNLALRNDFCLHSNNLHVGTL